MNGKLITFESCEGAGKTTHIKLLAEYLKGKGHNVVVSREPGGIEFSEDLRKQFILNPDKYKDINARTLAFLFEASRSEFVEKFVKPNLEAGKVVLLDRFYDSTTAYQGHAGKIDINEIEKLNLIASSGIRPDLTIVINIDPMKGMEKTLHGDFGKADRMTAKGIEFQKKVMDGYLEIAKKEPERVKVVQYIDGNIDGMQAEIRKHVDAVLG